MTKSESELFKRLDTLPKDERIRQLKDMVVDLGDALEDSNAKLETMRSYGLELGGVARNACGGWETFRVKQSKGATRNKANSLEKAAFAKTWYAEHKTDYKLKGACKDELAKVISKAFGCKPPSSNTIQKYLQ